MPCVQVHQRKYENTDALVNEPIMEVESTCHFDWLAIIMYYGAYHLVHKHFADRSTPIHPQKHQDTLGHARNVRGGSKVYGELQTLFNACNNARYEDYFHDSEDLAELKESYGTIKRILDI